MKLEDLAITFEKEARKLARRLHTMDCLSADQAPGPDEVAHAHAIILRETGTAKSKSPRYDFSRHLAALRTFSRGVMAR